MTAILVIDSSGTSYFFCQRGSDDSRWPLASVITSAASLFLRDSINDSELSRKGSSIREVGKESQFQDQEAAKGAGFSHGLKKTNKNTASRVEHVGRRLFAGRISLSIPGGVTRAADRLCNRLWFRIWLMFITTFCLSLSTAGCLFDCLSVCLSAACPVLLWGIQIIRVSFLEVERVKIHYI